jgi:hypothetical protein
MPRRAEPEEINEPPRPPGQDRRLELRPLQLIGFPVLALIPVLAMAGLFGESWTSVSARSASLGVLVEYPTRFRARLSKPVSVVVENRSTAVLDTVEVSFDSTFVDRFPAITFAPEPHDAYVVSLNNLKPREQRRVRLEIDGERVGRHRGRVVARTRDDSAAVELRTVVFP